MSAWTTVAFPVSIRGLPVGGMRVELEATPELRAEIAGLLGLVAIEALSVRAEVLQARRGGARVVGRISARLTQTCVVTLDPVEQELSEPFEVAYAVPEEAARLAAEAEANPEAPDPPDVLEGETIDLGTLAYEHLAVGIDPYPRREGAVFDPAAAGVDDKDPGPFAALSALRDRKS